MPGSDERQIQAQRLISVLKARRRQRLNAKPPTKKTGELTGGQKAVGCGVLIAIVAVVALVGTFCFSTSKPKVQTRPTPRPVLTPHTIRAFNFDTCNLQALAVSINNEVARQGYSPFVIVGEMQPIPTGSSTDTRIQFHIQHNNKLYLASGTVHRWTMNDPDCWYSPGSILPAR